MHNLVKYTRQSVIFFIYNRYKYSNENKYKCNKNKVKWIEVKIVIFNILKILKLNFKYEFPKI